MKLVKNYIIFLTLTITSIVIYLTLMFVDIEYNPNYKMKGHHDYAFNGYLLFGLFTCFWLVFTFGLFQLKFYLEGKERLPLTKFVFGGLFLYGLFLILLEYPFSSEKNNILHLVMLTLASLLMLVFSLAKPAKESHRQSKIDNQEKLRKRLGIWFIFQIITRFNPLNILNRIFSPKQSFFQ